MSVVVVSAVAATVAVTSLSHAWHHADRVEMLMAAVTIFCLAYIVYAVWVLPHEDQEDQDGD
jgi:hypothetical protein